MAKYFFGTSVNSPAAPPLASTAGYQSFSSGKTINWKLKYPEDYLYRPSLDYVLVFENYERNAQKTKHVERRNVIRRLKDAGLTISKTYSRDQKKIFIRIGADEDRLEEAAEKMGMELKLKMRYGGGYAVFSRPIKHHFEGTETRFFSSMLRIRIIRFILSSPRKEKGAEIDLHALEVNKILLQHYPLHEEKTKKRLLSIWPKAFFKPQPMEEIRGYFGEQVAMYFGFLGFYTYWLAWTSIIGIPTAILSYTDYLTYTYTDSDGDEVTISYLSYDGVLTPVYSTLLCLAVTFFLEGWKRQQSRLACGWNMQHFEKHEATRIEYKGEPRKGFWNESGDWVSLEDVSAEHLYPASWLLSIKGTKPRKYLFGGYIGVSALLSAVIIGSIALLAFKTFLGDLLGDWAYSYIGSVVFVIFIQIFNQIYRRYAVWLNNLENHRTDTAYDDAMISKVFLFQFVNSYVAYYFIAFVKGSDVDFFGMSEECKSNVDSDDVDVPNCMYELHSQLAYVFAMNVAIGNIIEVVIPYAKHKLKSWKSERKMRSVGENLDRVKMPYEEESDMVKYESTFDDFSEMMVQFGYVTLFSAAFPLAALLALANNLIEIRSDAYKLLTEMQRPDPDGAQDIGNWYRVLEIMSGIAVLTNMGVLFVDSTTLEEWVASTDNPVLYKLVIVLSLEHGIFLFRYIISEAIPDVPEEVRIKLAYSDKILELEKRKDDWMDSHPGADLEELMEASAPTNDLDEDPGFDTEDTDQGG